MTNNNELMNNKPAYFITGTDTDCGKTQVSTALVRYLQQKNRRVAGIKPIASGFQLRGGQWQNDDVEALKLASNVSLPPKQMNRYAYRPAIAPHIAAERANEVIDIDLITKDVEQALESVDALVVEGVGGWLVPLSADGANSIETLAQKLELPIILVVGLKLGCLSHALLTAKAITQAGLPFAGWVANHIDPNFDYVADNLATLVTQMPAPRLFELPYIKDSTEFGRIGAFSQHWAALKS